MFCSTFFMYKSQSQYKKDKWVKTMKMDECLTNLSFFFMNNFNCSQSVI